MDSDILKLALGLVAVLVLDACRTVRTNPPNTVVRVCTGVPTTQGWSACSGQTLAAYWTYPAPWAVLDVLRQGQSQDIWITPDQLIAHDRVFVCQDPSVPPGQWVSCPNFLPGQTNNWMDASLIDFTGPPHGAMNVKWQPPIETDEMPPQPIDPGTPMSYEVYQRSNNCGGGIPPNPTAPPCQADYGAPVLTTNNQNAKLSMPQGPWCVSVDAFWAGSDPNTTRGVKAPEICAASITEIPGVPQQTTVTAGP